MYQSIGINLSKNLDALTKRIKVPAITQRDYYKDLNNCEEEYVNFYNSTADNDIDYNENLDYLDDDYEEENCCCEDSCLMDKIKNLDSKVIVGASVGALIGCIGLYILLKKR
ncbi:hypothetical protein ABFP60_04985 [Clostridioides difficile]